MLRRALNTELGREKPDQAAMPISSGVLYALLEETGALSRRAAGRRPAAVELPATEGCQNTFTGGGQVNTRVTQDCSLRAQASASLAINSLDESNMLVSQDDSRVGFGHCSFAWTRDGAGHWGDETPPFFEFQLLDGHAADACADPTVAWDSQGNAYIAAVLFHVKEPENGIVVAKSNAGIHGAYFHSPDDSASFQEYSASPLGVVESNDDPNEYVDKAFVAADANPGSPKQDWVYVTWTRFMPEEENGIRQLSPIFFSQSTDGGTTWTERVEISGEAAGVCPTECFNDQGSHPVVGPDGTIYVSFANKDAMEGGEQILMVKCRADEDCTIPEAWTEPVIVSDLIGGAPVGPSPEGCPSGSQCLPPNGYAMTEMMSVSNSVDEDGNLYVVWADFRNNTNAQCTGNVSSAAPPSDNDVFYSVSTDKGETWSEPRDITPRSDSRFGETAQWQPWSQVTDDGEKLWVSFYDRSYGSCETTGCNDVTVAEIVDPASANPSFDYSRVTTSSMPNLTLASDPLEAGFLGDRMSVELDSLGRAHVAWADTRPHAGIVARGRRLLRSRAGSGGASAASSPAATASTASSATAASPSPAAGSAATATSATAGEVPCPAGDRATPGAGEGEDPASALLGGQGSASPLEASPLETSGPRARAEPARRVGATPGIPREAGGGPALGTGRLVRAGRPAVAANLRVRYSPDRPFRRLGVGAGRQEGEA